MSTVMPQQLPKEDEEEEDEEQGEEFVFEDSSDEEKPEEDSKGISSHSVQLTKNEGSETSESVSQTGTDSTPLLRTLPPAGQEGIPTKDVASNPTAGNTFSAVIVSLN